MPSGGEEHVVEAGQAQGELANVDVGLVQAPHDGGHDGFIGHGGAE